MIAIMDAFFAKFRQLTKAPALADDESWEAGLCFVFARVLAGILAAGAVEYQFALVVAPDEDDVCCAAHCLVRIGDQYLDARGSHEVWQVKATWAANAPGCALFGREVSLCHLQTWRAVAEEIKNLGGEDESTAADEARATKLLAPLRRTLSLTAGRNGR